MSCLCPFGVGLFEMGMLKSVGLLLPLAPSKAQALDALWSLTEQLPQSITVAISHNMSKSIMKVFKFMLF